MTALIRLSCAALAIAVFAGNAEADKASSETFSWQAQLTHLWQYHSAFRSAYRGTNSLDPGSRADETTDATLYLRVRTRTGTEIEADPEVDQGFGLSNTMGVAAFPSGEAYKLGKTSPYLRLQRVFVRQTINLNDEESYADLGPGSVGDHKDANDTLTLTAGKFSIIDIFDTNVYAHDPRADFMNWAVIDAGAFDYAGDAWGYSYGFAAEWTFHCWTVRAGLFNLSREPGGTELQRNFGQFEVVGEVEHRSRVWGQEGTLKLLGFLNRGRMGAYLDAVHLAEQSHATPSTAFVRTYASRLGGVLNLQQSIDDNLGLFARLSMNDGSKETFDFTDINRSMMAGVSLKGASWGRPSDVVGIAVVSSGLSRSARTYFAAGGLGILIGDGRLTHYGSENVIETYYDWAVIDEFMATADYQWIANPAFNRDRGPVSILSIRLHVEI